MEVESPIQEALQKAVNAGAFAGAATLVWRNGEIQTACAGWRDKEANLPIERDTIFRLASMSKPITSLAALMLVEQNGFALTDPISKFAPEFSDMRVLRSPTGPLNDTVPAARQITFEDLLTHRAGLTYADLVNAPITPAYRETLGGEIDNQLTPDEWMARLAKLPLIGQPGAGMTYSCATDLLGFLLARVEGLPLSVLLKRLIFDPLGMKDTGFLISGKSRRRRASAYGFDDAGKLIKVPEWVWVAERPDNMTYESGGSGLWSTVDDYLKVARLFVSNGEVDGVRLLRPDTVAMMTTNQLTDQQRASFTLLGQKSFAVGRGFGMGVSVVLETNKSDWLRRGNPGTVSWPGAYGAWWQADPQAGSILIFLATSVATPAQMSKGFGLGVWGSIGEFQRLAS